MLNQTLLLIQKFMKNLKKKIGLLPFRELWRHTYLIITPLVTVLKAFDELVRNAYRKAISGLPTNMRKDLDSPDHHGMELFAVSPGSFKLHLQSKMTADLGGYAEIFKSMQKIDEIMEALDDPEHAVEILQRNRGHLMSSFRKFLQFVIELDAPLSYEWTTPSYKHSFPRQVTVQGASPVYKLLMEKTELNIEHKELTGVFTGANVETGTWTVISEDDQKHYTGRLDKTVDVKLDGAVLKTQRYRLICEERLEEEVVSGKEKAHLFLISFQSL